MSAAALIEVPELGLSLPAPAGTDVVCRHPLLLWLPEIDGLRPWFAMAQAPSESPSLEAWVADELARQQRTMEVPLLIACEACDLWGQPGIRTLVQHAVQERAITLAQWWTLVDGHGCLASASCATPHYHLVAGALDEMVRGMRFDDEM
jgi:hypothetical protein